MSKPALAETGFPAWTLPGWAPSVALLIGTALVGPALGGLARPLFILGCAAAGWLAWRRSPAAHLQSLIILFAFAPFVRRIVDLSAGYDQMGLMLVGPLLAMAAPAPTLWRMVDGDRPLHPQIAPILMVGACVIYAAALSTFEGDWINAASGALKWTAPLLYAAALTQARDPGALTQSAASAFMVVLPVMGLYGIYQYVDPPSWDQHWLNYSTITSAGQPVPFGVRTFSTMNGPASFATFTAAGLLLVLFLRSGWLSLAIAFPAALSFLLSLYRTAWLSFAVGVAFCLLFGATRRRAAIIVVAMAGALVVAGSLSPFSETIADRLATLGQGSQDGSVRERLEQFVTLWSQPDSSLFGEGFTITDVGSAGAMAIDGMIVTCWLTMGIVVGLLCLSGLVWAASNAIAAAWRATRPEAVMVGALACGGLLQLPFANITSGELGFLFWTFVALAPLAPMATPAPSGKPWSAP